MRPAEGGGPHGGPPFRPAPGPDLVGSVVNPLWLAELPAREGVLAIARDPAPWVQELACHFSRVHLLEASDAFGAGDGGPPKGGGVCLPFPAGTFDCVVLWSLPRRLGGRRFGRSEARRFLAECRRVLRPGGCLYMAGEKGPGARGWTKALRGAGFRRVRAYYALPSHEGPGHLVPSSGRAVAAFERARPTRGRRSAVRATLARLGGHRFLYRSMIHLAEG